MTASAKQEKQPVASLLIATWKADVHQMSVGHECVALGT
jgi:hypothetical protein